MKPILLLGAGRMGGALIAGWRRVGVFEPDQLMIRDPTPGPEALASGALIDPDPAAMAAAKTVMLLVKPQIWREVAAEVAPHLAPDAVIVSIAAGVASADIAAAFGGRRVARVMPTTAVAIGQGTASIFSDDAEARRRARALFGAVGVVVDLQDEDQMHAATAVSGSAPAYLYAFVEALEAAGVSLGLDRDAARDLARATVAGAAALKVLQGEGGLEPLLRAAAVAAEQRSRELGR